MSKQNDSGVYQKENGYWEFRFVIRMDGKTVCRKKCTDENGNHFKTKREAIAAREAAIVAHEWRAQYDDISGNNDSITFFPQRPTRFIGPIFFKALFIFLR